jgi:hypothetical protein
MSGFICGDHRRASRTLTAALLRQGWHPAFGEEEDQYRCVARAFLRGDYGEQT